MVQKWSVQYLRALQNMHVQAVRTQKTALQKATQIRTTTLEWKNMEMEDDYSDLARTDLLLQAAGRRIDRIMRYTRSNVQGYFNYFFIQLFFFFIYMLCIVPPLKIEITEKSSVCNAIPHLSLASTLSIYDIIFQLFNIC